MEICLETGMSFIHSCLATFYFLFVIKNNRDSDVKGAVTAKLMIHITISKFRCAADVK